MKVVIATGGNALKQGNDLSERAQRAAIGVAADAIIPIICNPENQVSITHGNGPQSGLMLKKEESYGEDKSSLNTIGGGTQGMIGLMLFYALQERLSQQGSDKKVVQIGTVVEVDPNDPAMQKPTKYIGKTYPQSEEDALRAAGHDVAYYKGEDVEGIRVVVPSPKPEVIMQDKAADLLMSGGFVPIVCGGGGAPIYWSDTGKIIPVDGVVDKDFTSMEFALSIDADVLLILTAAPKVYINYGTPEQKSFDHLTVAEVEAFKRDGHFPPGSMGPKMDAATEFVTRSANKNAVVIIAALSQASEALFGNAGTRITM